MLELTFPTPRRRRSTLRGRPSRSIGLTFLMVNPRQWFSKSQIRFRNRSTRILLTDFGLQVFVTGANGIALSAPYPSDGGTYFVTFHLADSLPGQKLAALEEQTPACLRWGRFRR